MNLLLLFFLLLIISCSPKEDDYTGVEKFMKKGELVKIFKESKIDKEILNIKSVDYNSTLRSNFFKKIKIYAERSIKTSDFLILKNNNILIIDKKSNLLLLDNNLKKKISIKIKKNHDQKDYEILYKLKTDEKKIFISDNLGNVYGADVDSLKILWEKNLGVPFSSDIKIDKDSIYIINSNSKIFSINKINGEINWSYETPSQLVKSKHGYRIEIIGDNLIFSNDYGEIYNLDLKIKSITWTYNLDNKNFKNQNKIFKISNFSTDNMKLYFSSNYGEFFSINTINGSILWKKEISNYKKIYIKKNNIFLIDDNNYFIIINKINGKILFKKNLNTFFDKKNIKNDFLNIIFDKGFINLIFENSIITIDSKNLNNINIIQNKLNILKYYIKGSNIFLSTENKLLKL